MSGCSDEEEISFSEADRRGYEGGSDDSEFGKIEHRRTRIAGGFGKVVVRQFAKAKKQVRRIRSRKSLLSKSRSRNEGKVIIEGDSSGRGSGCRFCFSRPKVLESPNEDSPTSDPNDPNFTHAMLRNLLDKNDFYSKECNPHLD
ncbi:hypothetical protein VNO78_18229 [Psophocarpus tetragonolobus]|uniref:Uncharacterized protein n=1 Tax=Psophocarpus tetragonolobus TaxID=3891 RepID=A0AAN9XLA7_PSOTE